MNTRALIQVTGWALNLIKAFNPIPLSFSNSSFIYVLFYFCEDEKG